MNYRAIGFGLLIILLGADVCTAQDRETLERARAYEPLMIEAGARYGVDPRLLWTIAFLETRFQHYDPQGRLNTSRAGARGMMQLMPATAARFKLRDQHEPADSIDTAARYLRDLQTIFDRRLDLVLAAYNSGEQTVMAFRDGRRLVLSNGKTLNPNGIRTGGIPPYRETFQYVSSGIALYLRLAGKNHRAPAHQRLKLPERISLEESREPTPEEITQLKLDSIYIVASTSIKEGPDKPSQPQKSATRSIYIR
jgi:Transglycosylase SLT domain